MSSRSSSSFDDSADTNITPPPSSTPSESVGKAIESLSKIIPDVSLKKPAVSLLDDHETLSSISSLLRRIDSGTGDNPLCNWLYDTFQTGDNTLQLVVLRFLPIIVGLYLSRVAQGKTCLGFEVILLTLYAHEATCRAGQSFTVNVPDMSHPSIYHDTNTTHTKITNSTELNLAVVSPSLEPCGAVLSTKRARIVGVALELYYSKITQIPIASKVDFCEFCRVWAGLDADMYNDIDKSTDHENNEELSIKVKEGRILLPWELLQPVLKILGHCLLGCDSHNQQLFDAAFAACRSLYARSLHDINSKAILATRSLLRLANNALESKNNDVDLTDIPRTNRITL